MDCPRGSKSQFKRLREDKDVRCIVHVPAFRTLIDAIWSLAAGVEHGWLNFKRHYGRGARYGSIRQRPAKLESLPLCICGVAITRKLNLPLGNYVTDNMIGASQDDGDQLKLSLGRWPVT